MHIPLRTASLILGVALVVSAGTLGVLLGNAALSTKALERTVVVKGLSEREVAANIATWPIKFQVAANDLEEVYALIERHSDTVTRFLSGHGISGDEISMGPPSVADIYAQQWGDKRDIKYRYTGSGSVTVYTEKVPAVLAAMADVIELGKQGVVVQSERHPGPDGRQFLFTRLTELKPEMVEEATKNARIVAEKFAADSDSRLGKIKSARQGQFSISDRDSTTPHIKKVRVVSTLEYYLSD